MPNFITVDGEKYGMSSPSEAVSAFTRVHDAMTRAQKDGQPKLVGWTSDYGDSPIYTVLLLTASSAVSMVLDRDARDETSVSIGESIADADRTYFERLQREADEREGKQPAS